MFILMFIFISLYPATIFGAATLQTNASPAVSLHSIEKEKHERIVDKETINNQEVLNKIPYANMAKYYVRKDRTFYEKVLLINDEIVGIIDYYYCIRHCYKAAHIIGVGVLPGKWNKDHGTCLMRYALDQMQKDGIEEVTLCATQESGLFHQKMGFKKAGLSGYLQYKFAKQTA